MRSIKNGQRCWGGGGGASGLLRTGNGVGGGGGPQELCKQGGGPGLIPYPILK